MSEQLRSPEQDRRQFRHLAILTAAVSILAIGIIGLGIWVVPQFGGSEPAADESPNGGTASTASLSDSNLYTEADVGFPETLNPFLATTESEKNASALVYRNLFRIGHDGTPKPDIARDLTISEDQTTYEVTVRDDLDWHDGEPLTVEDVLFTVSLVQDPGFPGKPALSRFWRGITVRRTGEQSITFTLQEPYAAFGNYLKLPILPKHVYGDLMPRDLLDEEFDRYEVGSGPYELVEVDSDRARLRFHAISTGDIDPKIEEIEIRYFDQRNEALEEFFAGEVEGASFVPIDALHDSSQFPEGARIYAPSLPGYTAVFFNMRHQLLRDVNVRRGLEYAIDRQQVVDSVLGGNATVGTSPIPVMMLAHQPGDHEAYDPGRAIELFEEAGWTFDDEQNALIREGRQFVLPMLVSEDDAQRLAVATRLQEQLREVGIALDIQARPEADLQQLVESRQFASVLYGWHSENGDPDCFQVWHSSQSEEGMNLTGFAHTHADELLTSARQTVDLDRRNEYYATFQEIFAEQVPAVVLFYPRYHFAVSANVEGAEPYPLVEPSDRMRQLADWSLNGDSAEARVAVSEARR